MSRMANKRLLILFTLLVAMLFLAACAGTTEEILETGSEGVPCKVVNSIPPEPDTVDESTTAATMEMTDKLVEMFKANTGAATLQGQAYVTEAGFIELRFYYENSLQPGWEFRDDLVNQFSGETANAAAWSSCTGELVVALFYKDFSPEGSLLVVMYAKP